MIRVTKQPYEERYIDISFVNSFPTGETIASVASYTAINIDDDSTITSEVFNGAPEILEGNKKVRVYMKGGANGLRAKLTIRLVGSAVTKPTKLEEDILLLVIEE